MRKEIMLFELKYRLGRPEIYIYFAFLLFISAMAYDFIYQGMEMGDKKINSPQIITFTMGVLSGFFMIINSMIMGVPILRDYEHRMESLLFVNPIRKHDYLLGRFTGSFIILILVFSAIPLGIMIGDLMPWRDPEQLQTFNYYYYLHPFMTIVLPNAFYGACIFFVCGMLSRKMIVVYTQGLLVFLILILSLAIKNPMIAGILDPFSHKASGQIINSLSELDFNTQIIPLTGVLLYNRLFWVALALIISYMGYRKFQLSVVNESAKKGALKTAARKDLNSTTDHLLIPFTAQDIGIRTVWKQLYSHSLFSSRVILYEPIFWAIILCGIGAILINSINLGSSYGVNSYPTTYLIMGELKEMSILFFILLLAAFTGEILWKERKVNLHLIYDALPMSDFINVAGKFTGVVITYLVMIIALFLFGILFQSLHGYYQFDISAYAWGFLEIWLMLVLFTFLAFFFQIVSNSKFIGHILLIVFFIGGVFLSFSGYGHGLYSFGGGGLGTYSDMNGYGHSIPKFLTYKLYWMAFCVFLLTKMAIIYPRGIEVGLRQRWADRKNRITPSIQIITYSALLIMGIVGAFIFYNTCILNQYHSRNDKMSYRANYEKTLKHLEYIPQPKIVDINLELDLYPAERNYNLIGSYILENKDSLAMHSIHIQTHLNDDEKMISMYLNQQTNIDSQYLNYGYIIYNLEDPLHPGDSIHLHFHQQRQRKGFSEDEGNTDIVYNGTFINNDRFPSIGYQQQYEISNATDREEHHLLPPNEKADRNHPQELTYGRSGGDGSSTNFEIVISTSADQVAIAPGKLEKEWIGNGRNYFHYKMDNPMINFYTIHSGRYKVIKEEWHDSNDKNKEPVQLEIYHHPPHDYNIDRMMAAMNASLTYYGQSFGPYQYEVLRIVEHPRYVDRAQSFPSTIAYSESMGFVMDIDDKTDVDIPFFVTAHEVAHQWWGMQLVAANVKGKHMILETLSQYSALMVMKTQYGEAAMQRILTMEKERYEEGLLNHPNSEVALIDVDDEDHIYYSKGALQLYQLYILLGEDQLNTALRQFLMDWNAHDGILQADRYPTSEDLVAYLMAATPPHQAETVRSLFY